MSAAKSMNLVTPDDFTRAASEALTEATRLTRKVARATDRKHWAQTDGAEALRLVRAARSWSENAERLLAESLASWERQP